MPRKNAIEQATERFTQDILRLAASMIEEEVAEALFGPRCPTFPQHWCSEVEHVNLFGLHGVHTVFLGTIAPETTYEDIQREFGGGEFELRIVLRKRPGDGLRRPLVGDLRITCRSVRIAGNPKWTESIE